MTLDTTQTPINPVIDTSPVKSLASVKLQSQDTAKAITDSQNTVIADRNNLTNQFLGNLEAGKASNKDYQYFADGADLNVEQQLKVQSIKNKFGLSDLKTNNPNDILQVFKQKQAAEYNNQFTPFEIKPYTPFANIVQEHNNTYNPIKNNPVNSSGEYDANSIQGYINKYSNGQSLMTANDFINASKESGVSMDALLTQARLESSFGTAGRGKDTKNALNYGNDDAGNNKTFGSYGEGLTFAAKRLVDTFGDGNGKFTADSFISRDFKGKYGRYATDPEYASKYSSILGDTRKSLVLNQVATQAGADIPATSFVKKDTLSRAYGGTAYVIDDKASIAGFGNPLKNMSINDGFVYRNAAGGGYNIGSKGQQLNVGIDLQAEVNTPFFAVDRRAHV